MSEKQIHSKTEKLVIFLLGTWTISIVIGLFFLLSACGAFTPQKRLNRIIKNHPELIKVDTLLIRDTVRISIPSVQIDTFVTIRDLHTVDTFYFEKEFVKIKVWEKNDTVYVSAKTDTIYKEVIRTIKVPCKNIVVQKKWGIREYLALLLFLAGCIVCYTVGMKSKNDKDYE